MTLPQGGHWPDTLYAYVAANAGGGSRLSTEMVGFYAALANRHNAPCDILVLGDSITEGTGASPSTNRWVDQLRDRLRVLYPVAGVTGGYGYVAANTITSSGFTTSGNVAGDAYGLGARSIILGASTGSGAGSISITRTCTSFDVHHVTPGDGSAFTVTIDGGSATTVTGAGGTQTWTSAALTDASHSIVITRSAGLAYVEGAMFYRGDETKGIRMWEGGHFGSRAGNYVSGGTYGTNWANAITRVSPDLIIIAFGTNDSTQVSVAQFQTDLTALIALVRTKAADAAIAIIPPFPRTGTLSPWASYMTAAATVATATANCVFFDVGGRVAVPSPDTYSLLSDGLHPSNKGHALLGDVVLSLLLTGN